MITVNLHISEGPVSRHVRVRAASLKRAMRIAGNGKPGVKVALAGPVRLVRAPSMDLVPLVAASRAA